MQIFLKSGTGPDKMIDKKIIFEKVVSGNKNGVRERPVKHKIVLSEKGINHYMIKSLECPKIYFFLNICPSYFGQKNGDFRKKETRKL